MVSVQPKESTKNKGGGSFVWKITLRQTLHVLWLFFLVNFLISALFWGGVLAGVEQSARMFLEGDPANAVFGSRFIDVGITQGQAAPHYLPTGLLNRLGMVYGERGFHYLGGGDWRYAVAAQVTPNDVMVLTFAPGILMEVYVIAGRILLIFQALWLLTGLFEISRSVRRTLLPISQLTVAAHQSMSAQQAPGDLHLGSTIDVLNAINEQRLDTRIDVEGEREELRGLAVAINAMLDRVDSAYNSQLRFVSDASHELRTPIAVIQGYANLLSRWGKEDPKALEESIAAIKSEAENMKELVEQLLFLARSDNNSITMEMDYIDLTELVKEVARESEMIGGDHKIACPDRPPLFVSGDAGLLKQAVRILVDNAFKYTPTGGQITLDAKMADGMATLGVTDSGVGIPPEVLPKLFDRFYRADASRTRQTGGAGLGLSIAKWIVDSHGGVIDIISREDLGTRVIIKLKPALSDVQSYTITTPLLESHRQER
ncbi:MAG: HAMP domain-containing histidine kinase [Oscillospiraceae bacterium]|nr:HAMP domain-containing histidine kinase [Oscillospiraceae bacterium]